MRRLILLTVLALGATVARAESGLFYLGAGVTSNKLHDIVVQGSTFPDIDSTSWKAFIGFRPIRFFAVEAGYLDLGSSPTVEGDCTFCCMVACRGTYRSDSEAFVAYALGFLPILVPFLDIYGKAGLARWKLNGSQFASVVFSDSGTDFAWGVGLQAHISMFGARLEYETFHIPNTSGATVASLSVFLTLF
jgi:hypothetical protein